MKNEECSMPLTADKEAYRPLSRLRRTFLGCGLWFVGSRAAGTIEGG